MRNFEEDEVVVSGIGGNFPECDTLDELVDNLMNGVDMVTEERPRWEPGESASPTDVKNQRLGVRHYKKNVFRTC